MFPARQRLRDEASPRQVLEMPLGRTLCLPRPKDPARARLIRIQLRLDEVLQVDFVDLRHAIDGAGVLAVAAAVVCALRERGVVARALAQAVEPLRAVRLRAGPLADDGPFVRGSEFLVICAGVLDVLARLAANLIIGEDLVDVGVEDHVIEPAVGVGEPVPGADIEEGVVHHYGDVAVEVAHCSPPVVVVLLDETDVYSPVRGLVDEFDGGYYVGEFGVSFG